MPLRPPSALRARLEPLVPVAACARPVDAHLIRCRLEAEGIEAVVTDEHFVNVLWLDSAAVKVQVPAEQVDRAREILAATARTLSHSARFVTDDLAAPRCARCGCLEMEQRLALPFLRRRPRCRGCGAPWRTSPSASERSQAAPEIR